MEVEMLISINISRNSDFLGSNKHRVQHNCWHFNTYEQEKIILSWVEHGKKNLTSGPHLWSWSALIDQTYLNIHFILSFNWSNLAWTKLTSVSAQVKRGLHLVACNLPRVAELLLRIRETQIHLRRYLFCYCRKGLSISIQPAILKRNSRNYTMLQVLEVKMQISLCFRAIFSEPFRLTTKIYIYYRTYKINKEI